MCAQHSSFTKLHLKQQKKPIKSTYYTRLNLINILVDIKNWEIRNMSCIYRKAVSSKQTSKKIANSYRNKYYMYSPSLIQWEKFDEVVCCVGKYIENIEIFINHFLPHWY